MTKPMIPAAAAARHAEATMSTMVCAHGSLARQCLMCEIDAEVARLRAERDAALQRAEQAEAASAAKQFVIDMTLDEQARLRAEVGTLRRALTTLEGTLAAEIANCRTLIDERDAALQRAEEAEREARTNNVARVQMERELDAARQRAVRRIANTPPPALPPLPIGWEPHDEGAHTHATFRRWSDIVEAISSSPEVLVDALATPADLITVLRHAEAAHLKLKEGQ